MDEPGRPRRRRRGVHRLRHESARARTVPRRHGHPDDLVSIVLVDGVSEGDGPARTVTSFGAFRVRIVDGDPVFASSHVWKAEPDRRPDVLHQLARLCHGRDVVLGSADAHETFWDRRHVLGAGIAFLDAIHSQGDFRPADLTLVGTHESLLSDLASSFGLYDCRERDLFGQARCADVRAQLFWLAYVASKGDEAEVRRLFAAFRAWEMLERARPVPF